MIRIVSIVATGAMLAACAPVVVEQPVGPAFPEFFAAEPIPIFVEQAGPASPPPPSRTATPVIPPTPEGIGEELPPQGEASCGGVGIEAGC